jgi:myo-inositol-1(or 4)-monophosphatase
LIRNLWNKKLKYYNMLDDKNVKFVITLCRKIRKKVLPYLGKQDSRLISGKSIGGDSTFMIDDIAETFLKKYLKDISIAYYSEDRGLIKHGPADKLLIIDPIDGTRAAVSGLESCCISIALSEFTDEPKIKDLKLGCVQEIKSGRIFVAKKDYGVKIIHKGKITSPSLSGKVDIDSLFWSMGIGGKPITPLITVLEELINSSNFNGSIFSLGSSSFSITRVASGQLDCYIDIGHRIVTDHPSLERGYMKVGQGSIVNNYAYDIAAAYLILKESSGIITDAYGKALDDRPLMGIGKECQLSVIASSNQELHSILLMMIEKGFSKLQVNMESS